MLLFYALIRLTIAINIYFDVIYDDYKKSLLNQKSLFKKQAIRADVAMEFAYHLFAYR